MYGGTITSPSSKKGAIGINAAKIKVVGGKIQNYDWGIFLEEQTNVSATIGNVTFENNNCDIVMPSRKKLPYKMTSKELQVFINGIVLNTHI